MYCVIMSQIVEGLHNQLKTNRKDGISHIAIQIIDFFNHTILRTHIKVSKHLQKLENMINTFIE